MAKITDTTPIAVVEIKKQLKVFSVFISHVDIVKLTRSGGKVKDIHVHF